MGERKWLPVTNPEFGKRGDTCDSYDANTIIMYIEKKYI